MTSKISEIKVKRLKNTHSMRLRIDKDGQPVLTLPYWIPKKIGLLWANKQKNWIEKNSFTPNRFQSNQKILFLGKEVLIQHTDKRIPTHIKENILWVGGDEVFLPRRITDFIRKEFRPFIFKKVLEKEQKLGVAHTRLTLRDTSSRWGSCSSNKCLNFCWRLAMTPEFVIDYLVAHEVAHLKHMNHSPLFWKTVAELTPHTNIAKKWLKEKGKNLPR